MLIPIAPVGVPDLSSPRKIGWIKRPRLRLVSDHRLKETPRGFTFSFGPWPLRKTFEGLYCLASVSHVPFRLLLCGFFPPFGVAVDGFLPAIPLSIRPAPQLELLPQFHFPIP